ncbi:hypothetical protein D3C73_1668560 [compost metagenome]
MHDSSSIFSGYFLLIGTSLLRSSSFGACSDRASDTSMCLASSSIIGTTPEVDRVTRRLEMP